jgi:hypothetical protein
VVSALFPDASWPTVLVRILLFLEAGSVPAMRKEHDREKPTPHDEDGNIDRKDIDY